MFALSRFVWPHRISEVAAHAVGDAVVAPALGYAALAGGLRIAVELAQAGWQAARCIRLSTEESKRWQALAALGVVLWLAAQLGGCWLLFVIVALGLLAARQQPDAQSPPAQ